MSIIARTAGIGRSAPELQWDLNYLLKLWSAIDGAAKGGKGAFLIYQESSLGSAPSATTSTTTSVTSHRHRRHLRTGAAVHGASPGACRRVKRYRDDAPCSRRFQIEHQIDRPTPHVPCPRAVPSSSTTPRALVSVDVNSACAIRGGDIEETATRTNLEAADEVARQMRLRDLGGLIVIDFIDMEERRTAARWKTACATPCARTAPACSSAPSASSA